MKIYPTYKSNDWLNGTVLIDGLREYYSGNHMGMRQLARIPHQNVLNALTRIKPYENTLHVHKTCMGRRYSPYSRVKSVLSRWV